MRNYEHIKYTYKHRKIVMFLAKKYFGDNLELLEQVAHHDLDKMFMYLFYNKSDVSHIHRDLTRHHENDIEKSELDYIEMVLDWESARYTKPDKPLNAYDTLVKYYPHMEDKVLPILDRMGIAEGGLPMEKDVLEYTATLDNVSEEVIVSELVDSIGLITCDKNKTKIKQQLN